MIRKSTHTFPQRRDLVAVDNNLGSGATGSSSSLLGNMRQRRVVSLDSIDSRDQDQSNSNAKKRSHSAGNPGGACGSVMHPLLFEEVDLGNTPLSSLRSCSEFQKMYSNSSWRGRLDEQANNKK